MSREAGVVSDKDTAEVWEAAQEGEIEKVRGNKNKVSKGRFTCGRRKRRWKSPSGSADQTVPGYVEGGGEAAHSHTNGSQGLSDRSRLAGRGCPLVVRQRSVKEKEWSETFKIFGIGKEGGKKIIHRLGYTLLNEHEKLFGSYWRHTFGTPSSLWHLLGKVVSVRASHSPQGVRGIWRNITTGILSSLTTRQSLYIYAMYVNLFFLFILSSIIGLCYLPPARDRVHGEYLFLGEGNSS